MIKIKFLFIAILSLLTVNQVFCNPHVAMHEVKPLTEQLFKMHVTERGMSSKLIKRSLFLMIQDFDESGSYLLEEEKTPFLEVGRPILESAVAGYHRGQFPLHHKLLSTIDKAIARHQIIRAQVRQQVLAHYRTLLGQEGVQTVSIGNTDDIAKKIEKSYVSLIKVKLKERGQESFSKSTVEAILAYQDQLWSEREDRLGGEKGHALLPVQLVKYFARSMDVHSDYFSPAEAAHLRASLNKQMCGIGVVFRRDFDGLYINEVIKGAPADLSNKVHAGDKVIAVEGQVVDKIGFKKAIGLMKGCAGKTLHLTLRKGGKKNQVVQEVSLKRAPIVLNDQRVSSRATPCGNGMIGLINFPGFYSNGGSISAAGDLKREIVKLQGQGDLKGIVLDMRENGGGFLDQAIKVCKLFMPGGLVAIAKYKDNKVRFMNHVGKKPLYEGPLVILTSKASASAAEIVSQTLQDYGLAIVAGDEEGTFGKGSMQTQTVTNEKAEHFFKVTVARYYTASGRSPQAVGVSSDVVVNSHYFPYTFGEKHLTFALSPDVLDEEVFDQLHRASGVAWSRGGGARAAQVVPYLSPRMSAMRQQLRQVKHNSEERLKKDHNFQYFLKTGRKKQRDGIAAFGSKDLQMQEAAEIVKDLVAMQ